MNDENQIDNAAERLAKTLVRSGFYDRDRAIETVWDNYFEPDETGEAEAEKLVDAEFEKNSRRKKVGRLKPTATGSTALLKSSIKLVSWRTDQHIYSFLPSIS